MANRSMHDTGRTWLLDGGTGSELRRRGVDLSETCWSAAASISHADVLADIHKDYVDAGADIITANTFAASRFVLDRARLGSTADAVVETAIRTAVDVVAAARRTVAVAGSISCLPPGFDVCKYPSREAEYSAYAQLTEKFAQFGLDWILLEMMQDDRHASLACRAASAAGIPFWLGISCRRSLIEGGLVSFDDDMQPISRVLDACLGYGPAGVTVMHSPIDAVEPALELVQSYWNGPIGAYAEIPYSADPNASSGESIAPDQYAATATKWLARGATLIGGCCGTTPRHIAALRRLVDSQ